MPTFRLLRTMLDVHSIEETIAFYRDRLGFELVSTFGDDPDRPSWCQLRRDDVWLMFTKGEPHTHDDGEVHAHEPALGGALYINVDDADATYAEFQKTVDGFEYEPEDMPYNMREFALRDPNGFVLIFGSSIEG